MLSNSSKGRPESVSFAATTAFHELHGFRFVEMRADEDTVCRYSWEPEVRAVGGPDERKKTAKSNR